MLSIRMQRTGRKGHAMFRVVVQESRLTPTSGKVVALLGSYDPHAKTLTLDKEKATTYLNNGAQPSDRAAFLFEKEGIKLPKWVKVSAKREGKIRNQDKLRRNQTPEPVEEAPAAEVEAAEEAPADAPEAETGTTES
jgi:small subunit ribosomal protein S16